ncbi:MAG: condensation domain-containing protein, partial [Exilibacterium sp.]
MNKALSEVDALIDILNKKGISLDVKGGSIRYRGPAHAMTMTLKHEIKKHKDVLLERLSKATVMPWPHFTSNIAYLYKPFPLTDLQQAYLVGEQEFYQQRTIAYNYQQYRVTNFSYDKFLSAIDRLIKTRDILRTTYFSNGTQQINREIQYAPQFEDLTHLNEEQITSRIDKKRIDIVDDLAPLDEGPPMAISIQKTRSDYRIHIIVRLIAFDGITLNLIYRDLIGAYSKLDYVPPVPELSYRDYVLGIEEFRKSDAYRDSLKYWLKRTALMPPAPDLPRVKVPGQDSNFKRKSGKLRSDKWGKLSENARVHGKPINVVLFAIYVDTLKRWSRNKDFTIVLLSANRPQQEVDTSGVLGNCSTTSLIEVSNSNDRFIERIDQLQRRIYEDLQHNAVSGVEVIRHIQSKSSSKEAPVMPVVFTSGIGLLGSADHFDLLIPDDHWELVGSRLSTPQVWLDQQVYLEKGELVFNWDYAENVFPTGMIDEMFDFYSVQLERITSSPKAWDYDEIDLPGKNFIRRNCVNQTKKHLNVKPLHYPLIANYGAFPSKPALVSDAFCASYKELFHLCCLINHSISKSGIDQNSLIGVFVLRKDTQIISAISCLFGGNAYLPLDPKMPVDRVIWILRQSCAAAVIVDEATAAMMDDNIGCTKIMLPKIDREAKHYRSAQSHKDRLPDVRVDCIAYVIYTSGSTGRPKGVVIDHKGA